MSLVLDSSVALAGIYLDESTDAIKAIFERIVEGGAWVPGLWRLEIANILETGTRRGRHDAAFTDASLEDLGLLPIQVDSETEGRAWGPILQLARKHRLTSYDAAYLELAIRRRLPLATLDKELIQAASKEGVVVLGR